jgi:DNA invertase Pin-like site-specific DNA recombinase
MRVAVYIRVSDQSQVDGYSLDAQERQGIDFCRKNYHVPVRVYREEGRSARYESVRKRPVFREMLSDAERRQFDIVLVHTLDRFSRNMKVMLEAVGSLEQSYVGLVSATESLDWSRPEGRMVARSLGNFSEFFSDMLAKHRKKGIDERARQGKHLGSLPFAYESCWRTEGKEKALVCKPEHPGGIHVHKSEGNAVTQLFSRYATGTTTLATLASFLIEEGFRTRNTKRLADSSGEKTAGPRLFTTASVRGILHNPFYTGRVRYQGNLHPGLQEPLVTQSVFDQVQAAMKKNSGRSETLASHPECDYLLKGIIRCAWCPMPMWAQTYNNGHRYCREQYGSRGAGECVNRSGSIRCAVSDGQMDRIVSAIELRPRWQEQVMAIISVKDDLERVKSERKKVQEKLRHLGMAFVDGIHEREDYKRRLRNLGLELE